MIVKGAIFVLIGIIVGVVGTILFFLGWISNGSKYWFLLVVRCP